MAVGVVSPVTLRTYCRAAAVISSVVAGGSRPRRVVMFRHIFENLDLHRATRSRRPPGRLLEVTITPAAPNEHAPVDPVLLRAVYLSTFHLQDGSTLASLDASALDSMRGSLQRLLAVGDPSAELLGAARALVLLQGRRRGSRFI